MIFLAVALSALQITQAQGTATYLSNLGQPSSTNFSVGSDGWFAAGFSTGTNAGGYLLDSVQLAMADALGNPSSFTVMVYSNVFPIIGFFPGSLLATLNGSLSPVTGGIYTYTPASSLTLSPRTPYFIVLTAGTAIADGTYEWSATGVNSYNRSGGWFSLGYSRTLVRGSRWLPVAGTYAQFAVNATAIPEPGVLTLFFLGGLGGLGFLWHRRRANDFTPADRRGCGHARAR